LGNLLSFWLEPISLAIGGLAILFHSILQKHTKHAMLCGYYLIASVLMFRANLVGIRGVSNIDIYNLLNLITVIFFGLYFCSIISSVKKRIAMGAMCLLIAIYFIKMNLFPSPESIFDSTGQVLLSAVILIMVFFFMAQLLQNVNEESLSMNFDFWFSSAQLTYYLATFFIFLTFRYLTKKVIDGDYLDQDRELLTKLWAVHNVILFLSSSIIAGSTLWIRYRSKSASS
jgi:hypothetical protein